jgi:hypothetical protein
MKSSRKEDISVYIYIKDCILGPEFIESYLDAGLSQVSPNVWDIAFVEIPDSKLYPFKRGNYTGVGRGIPYFNTSSGVCNPTREQTQNVVVRNGATTISGYVVNYIKGQVNTSQDLSSCVVDYGWCYIATLDAWPSSETLPALPFVTVEVEEGDKSPLQLGGGDIKNAWWNVQIFANTKAERDDIADVIFDGVYNRSCPIYALQAGLPLTKQGVYNQNYSADLDTTYRGLRFFDVKKQLTGLPSWGFWSTEVTNKNRAQITFQTEAFKS